MQLNIFVLKNVKKNKKVKRFFIHKKSNLFLGLSFILLIFGILFFSIWSFVLRSSASFNSTINYQAKIADSSGTIIPNGSYNMRFSFCSSATGSCVTPIWKETRCFSSDNGSSCGGSGIDQRVVATNGFVNVALGSISSFSGIDFKNDLYLQIEIAGSASTPGTWEAFSPRKKLNTSSSALSLNGYNWDSPGTIGATMPSTGNFNLLNTPSLRILNSDGAYGVFSRNSTSNELSLKNTKLSASTLDSYTKLLLHYDSNFLDSSGLGHSAPTSIGAPEISSNSKFSAGSLKLNGASYLAYNSTDYYMTDTKLTIDFWVMLNSSSNYVTFFSQTNPSNIQFRYYPGHIIFGLNGTHIQEDIPYTISTGVFHHMALVRNGNYWYIFVDGNIVTTFNYTSNPGPSASPYVYIGVYKDYSQNYLDGYIDEFRISTGIARWTSSFTPPAEPVHGSEVIAGPQLFSSHDSTDPSEKGVVEFGNTSSGLNIQGKYISFKTNNADKMFLSSGGNLGIGTTTPSSSLVMQGSDPELKIMNSENNYFRIKKTKTVTGDKLELINVVKNSSGVDAENNFIIYDESADPLEKGIVTIGKTDGITLTQGKRISFSSDTGEKFRLNSVGLGISNYNPASILDIAGTQTVSSTGGGLTAVNIHPIITPINSGDAMTGLKIDPSFSSGTNQYGLTITNGNVGIGVDNASSLLTISGVNPEIKILNNNDEANSFKISKISTDHAMLFANMVNIGGTQTGITFLSAKEPSDSGESSLNTFGDTGGEIVIQGKRISFNVSDLGEKNRLNSTGLGLNNTAPYFLLDLAGNLRIRETSSLYFGGTAGSDNDVNLYRGGADILQTDDSFRAAGYQSSDGTAGISSATATIRNATDTGDCIITQKNGLIVDVSGEGCF